ncbi:hypothetical protein FH972_026369 [Carpinus fangiana]|uniref:Uncharacterized protein n=1 Tax=Carpinus fangiana TaxID=176857 RepID=A0A5N6L3W6_9ROSI|nr:hypothetical protein FH972_026369 [Carpinus fangiana]
MDQHTCPQCGQPDCDCSSIGATESHVSTDSGYASQALTSSSTKGKARMRPIAATDDERIVHYGKSFFGPKQKILKHFKGIDVSEQEFTRFTDLQDLLCRKIAEYGRKEGVLLKPFYMTLVHLGPDLSEARPCILVTCSKTVLKPVTSFFAQKWVKEQLEPPPFDGFPTFKLYVAAVPSRALTGNVVKVFQNKADVENLQGLNGRRIFVKHADTWATSTIGGVIHVTWEDGKTFRFALTAGHLFSPWHSDDQTLSSQSESSDDNSLSVISIEDSFSAQNEISPASSLHDEASMSLCDILEPAEIELESAHTYQVPIPTPKPHSSPPAAQESDLSVLGIYWETSNLLSETLDYAIVNITDEVLCHNDQYNTGILHGYVTSVDLFGDGEVMPMRAAFADMESRLGAKSVKIAGTRDDSAKIGESRPPTSLSVVKKQAKSARKDAETTEQVPETDHKTKASSIPPDSGGISIRLKTPKRDERATMQSDRSDVDSGDVEIMVQRGQTLVIDNSSSFVSQDPQAQDQRSSRSSQSSSVGGDSGYGSLYARSVKSRPVSDRNSISSEERTSEPYSRTTSTPPYSLRNPRLHDYQSLTAGQRYQSTASLPLVPSRSRSSRPYSQEFPSYWNPSYARPQLYSAPMFYPAALSPGYPPSPQVPSYPNYSSAYTTFSELPPPPIRPYSDDTAYSRRGAGEINSTEVAPRRTSAGTEWNAYNRAASMDEPVINVDEFHRKVTQERTHARQQRTAVREQPGADAIFPPIRLLDSLGRVVLLPWTLCRTWKVCFYSNSVFRVSLMRKLGYGIGDKAFYPERGYLRAGRRKSTEAPSKGPVVEPVNLADAVLRSLNQDDS